MGPDPTLNLNCFLVLIVQSRVVASSYGTPTIGPESTLNLLHFFHSSRHHGTEGYDYSPPPPHIVKSRKDFSQVHIEMNFLIIS